MEGRRTGMNFENHQLIVTQTDGLLVHYLRKPNTICDSIKYINTNGILAVTGDYGNWIFCREFIPAADNYVSEHYWNSKLRNSSSQEPQEWDSEETCKRLKDHLNDPDYEHDDEQKEYIKRCMQKTGEGEFDYTAYAYHEAPRDWDSESVIFAKTTKYWLKLVYDGFDEICRRIKEKSI